MGQIKNIIFDLGGVILNINYLLTEKAFKDLGCADFEKKYSQALQNTLFDDYETGKIDDGSFIKGLKEIFKIQSVMRKLFQLGMPCCLIYRHIGLNY